VSRQRVVHAPRFPLVSPVCNTYVGCGALYALDDEGEYRPEWVTCKRCLGVRGRPPTWAELLAGRNSRDGPVASQDRLAQTPAAAKRRESDSRLALGSGGDGGGP
jgi:hypothetical protein